MLWCCNHALTEWQQCVLLGVDCSISGCKEWGMELLRLVSIMRAVECKVGNAEHALNWDHKGMGAITGVTGIKSMDEWR